MTCTSCVASVSGSLSALKGVQKVKVNLEKSEAQISMEYHIPVSALQETLPEKYSISLKTDVVSKVATATEEPSKWQQLKPLFLIFFYLFSASFFVEL